MEHTDRRTADALVLKKAHGLKGELSVPGDKSISHRAVMFGALADGTTRIRNFLEGADCLSTISCFKKMGIPIETIHNGNETMILIKGRGLYGLKKPDEILDVGNSGTTARLMSGILAAQNFETTITGDASIQKRPMKRIMSPLSMMGADITSLHDNECAPLTIRGRSLTGIHYQSPVASAQVKSSVLLAGLYAGGETSVTEPSVSRNHTELMLQYFGVPLKVKGTTVTVGKTERLTPGDITVPGDISSAAYFIAASLIVPHSEITIRQVGINPTRDGLLKVCRSMGASITLENETTAGGETMGDITVRTTSLKGTTIGGSLIPTLIDEIPMIAVLACFAEGQTVIRDAAELKVKESNRIDVMVRHLSAMGADITATGDGMIINGRKPLHGAVIDSFGDHRIAMSFAVAALAAKGDTQILDPACAAISYPAFYDDLKKLQG